MYWHVFPQHTNNFDIYLHEYSHMQQITFRLSDLVLCIFAGNPIGVRFEHALYNTSEGQFVVLVRLVSDRPFPVSGSIRIMPMETGPCICSRYVCTYKSMYSEF